VKILSSLQEISSNIDAISLAGRGEVADLPMIKLEMGSEFTNYDTTYNYGNKPLFGHGVTRIREFGSWVFTREEDLIIVGGHSLWCRDFFRTFLPYSVDHVSKNAKIKNCGLISLTLGYGKHNGQDLFRIEPESIYTVFEGFERPSKKSWVPPKFRHS